jgi:hypothetical protein
MRQRLGQIVIATATAALIRWLIRAGPAQEPGPAPPWLAVVRTGDHPYLLPSWRTVPLK